MSKKVLFISYDGMTDPLGQSQVIPYLEGLSGLGHLITIISAEKPGTFRKFSSQIQKQLESAGIKWHSVFYSRRFPGWSPWRNFRRLSKLAKTLHQGERFDLIHCRSYIPAMIGVGLKRNTGVHVIFDMRGFWADERVEGGLWNLNNPVYKGVYNLFKRKEVLLLEKSDAIVSLTENAKKEILSWEGLKLTPEKITVIPCCVDLEFFSPAKIDLEKQAILRRQLGISDHDFIISYSGSLGTWYLLEEMMRLFHCILQEKPGAKFLFITREPKEQVLEVSGQQEIASEKIIVVAATRGEMPLLLSLSQVSVFFIKNSFSKKASSPTKMGELMSLGIPVICNEGVGDVKEIIESTGAGIAVRDFSEDEFLRVRSQMDELRSISKEKIRHGAVQFYSLQNGIQQYDHIYSSL